jgi:hypothetical protein
MRAVSASFVVLLTIAHAEALDTGIRSFFQARAYDNGWRDFV